jgi:serine/threonine protein kinase
MKALATPVFEAWIEKRCGFEGLNRPAKLNDFEADKSLGKGAYGKVIQVKSKNSGKLYAMKVVAKKTIENHNMKDQLRNEISIMSKLSHPRIINLETIFEDQKNIYLVMELAEEKHLYARLQEAKKFDEATAAKSAFDVFQAVEYMHNQNPPIIHRDIKPENILYSGGHLKLADFGWSNLKDKVRTTFCGTPEYLAPEMLLEKGHNEKLDVWTLGVLLYEMLVGKAPFSPEGKDAHGKDAYEILKANIVVIVSLQ